MRPNSPEKYSSDLIETTKIELLRFVFSSELADGPSPQADSRQFVAFAARVRRQCNWLIRARAFMLLR